MSTPYFRYIPNFEYVNRLKDDKTISAYIQVKNLFRSGVLRQDIFQDLNFYTQYKIIGDRRPDEIAFEYYGSQYYDWVVLLSNNVINYESEWPMTQQSFENYLNSKYLTQSEINDVHHYESTEVKDSKGFIVFEKGLTIDQNYSFSYFDENLDQQVTVNNFSVPVTNLEYESKKENDKRNIFLLKPKYLNVLEENIESQLLYKSGSSNYIDDTLVRGDNIRLFQ